MYNDTYFPSNSKHFTTPSKYQPSCHIDELAFQTHEVNDAIPSADKLFHDTGAPRPPIETVTNATLDPTPTTIDFSNKLFFVQYTPENTLRARWYLIQVDMESTMEANPSYATNNLYYCVFLARHPNDHKKSDQLCRWWPDWYRYTRCPKTNDIIYGHRILIRPNTLPCHKKIIQWATLLPLCGQNTVSLAGPFDFEPINDSNRVRQKVALSQWLLLIDACALFGITPPTIGSPQFNKSLQNSKPSSKKRKR